MNQPAMGIEPDSPYGLTPQQVAHFRDGGYVKLTGVFAGDEFSFYGDKITRIVADLNPRKGVPMEQRGTYAKAFIQIGNLWTKSDAVKRFSFSKRLARIASELLGSTGVRMWHDQALYEDPRGGFGAQLRGAQ